MICMIHAKLLKFENEMRFIVVEFCLVLARPQNMYLPKHSRVAKTVINAIMVVSVKI